ncbi:MAG: general secretion pathway protein GspD [Pirellulaceae bacterium]|nr:general secretion pathway protein GspD [Pirellulaceae bacterium]
MQLSAGAISQTDQQRTSALLEDARKAIKAGRFAEADRLITQAERLNVQYEPLFARVIDTPQKLRAELNRQRTAAAARAVSQQRTPGVSGPPTPPGRFPSPSSAAGSDIQRLPPTTTTGSRYSDSPLAGAVVDNPRLVTNRRGGALLRQARQSLAKNDLVLAVRLAAQAKALNEVYSLNEDSPAKVEAMIRRGQQFASGVPSGNQREATDQYARYLVDQAAALWRHGDGPTARQLALNAKKLNVAYTRYETTPDLILQQIAGGPAGGVRASHPAKPEAARLTAMAKAALDRGDAQQALALVQQASALGVPDEAFHANELKPWQVGMQANRAATRNSGVRQAGYDVRRAVAQGNVGDGAVRQGVYNPAQDPTRVAQAQAQEFAQPTPARPIPTQPIIVGSPGLELYNKGIEALKKGNREQALAHFKEAWRYERELDPRARKALQDKLVLLSTARRAAPEEPSTLAEVTSEQDLLRQKLSREVTAELSQADRMLVQDPKGALNRLQKTRARVIASGLDGSVQKQLLTMVDQGVRRMEAYIDQNRIAIEQDERNTQIRTEIAQEQMVKLESQAKVESLVKDFNKLIRERRYHDAEIIAKQVNELDPQNPVARTLIWKSRFVRNIMEQEAIREAKNDAVVAALTSVEESSTPFDDRTPLVFGDKLRWKDLTGARRRMMESQGRRLLPAEVEIQKNLNTEVDVAFTDAPLAVVLNTLERTTGVPIHVDPAGLAAEAVTSDTPVTLNLSKPVSLSSALNLILRPLRLSYVVENEVLNVTSETVRETKVYTEVYNVADLVIPIPNFVPGYNAGLPAAIRDAHNSLGYGVAPPASQTGHLTLASHQAGGDLSNSSVLAQMGNSGMLGSQSSRPTQPSGMGAGGAGGGAAAADFDTLIELITSTIAPESWDEVGGAGAIESFPTNLSLVVSQTQDVHEQIADLLDQLRRLQDLQISIEVRFITLNDNFFERIGIDFDFDIDDNTGLSTRNPQFPDDIGPSLAFGLDANGAPTADLDLQFSQGSFGAAVPQFGNFDAMTAANFGFAILSDIEVFFLLQAAQGNARSNVLQAPKVTLFNGQSASVSDTSQRPFVTSIIPVVGDFAAAHQPVIVVLNEGTTLSVQAVVSSDRRFVRLTLVPFFSQIGDVDTFTFQGTTTTDSGSNVVDDMGNPVDAIDNITTTSAGSTVQLPTFAFTTVSTTVSVPDGGTVLLGGIKRLREGRTERGVPMLSKLPYISRLFKNVGIGRETQTLMLMVTPRIIIQEEEEAKLGIELTE